LQWAVSSKKHQHGLLLALFQKKVREKETWFCQALKVALLCETGVPESLEGAAIPQLLCHLETCSSADRFVALAFHVAVVPHPKVAQVVLKIY